MFNPEYKKVVFVHEWMGNPPGSKKTILKEKAEELEGRGIIEMADEVKTKMETSPVKDKMVKSPKKNKGKIKVK